ncbi:hypothetical protein VCHENC02_0314B, partial [Vibrio harveyi]
NTLRFSLMDLV